MIKAKRTGTKVTTGKVRLSYAHLFEPHAIEGNEPKYSVSVIIPKTDTERPDDEAYANCYFLNANSKNKPGVVDKNVQPVLDATEVYSGCYARLTLNFYAYSASGNKGIACGLGNVQKLEDGEPLGGFTRAEDDFDSVETAEDDFLG